MSTDELVAPKPSLPTDDRPVQFALLHGEVKTHSLPPVRALFNLETRVPKLAAGQLPFPQQASNSVHHAGAERRMRKSSSFIHLSMSSEGTATVVAKDISSPSPPRPVQLADHKVSQGQASSTTSQVPTKQLDGPALPPLKRSSSGRSRDSRTWEFWCDKDSRGELEEKADKDASGSAADAIGLLRSNSGRRILGSIPTKSNSILSRQQIPSKRLKQTTTVPGLERAKTSSARLQHGSGPHRKCATTLPPKHAQLRDGTWIPGNESDKENWSPTTDGNRDDRSASNISSVGDPTHGRSKEMFSKSRSDAEEDPEIAAFMSGGRRSSNVSGEEEMDCVQGLLSLSQGNWR
jgi:hypothetical protein